MRVGYVVSRFPHVSETFVVRELNAVTDQGGVVTELFSLFPPSRPLVHPSAERWVGRARRPGPAATLLGGLWGIARHPLRTARVVADVLRGYRGSGRLLRALAVLPLAFAQAREVRRLRIDHLHAHFASYPALAAWACHRMVGVTYSFTAHAHDIFLDQSMLAGKIREARFVAAISEYNRSFLTRVEPRAEGKILVVHCGIEPATYPFDPAPIPAAGPIRVVCVASLADYKGQGILIRALSAGGDRLARVDVDLVGSGPMQAELEDLAQSLRLGDRVTFRGGLTEPEVRRELASAAIFVLPSVITPAGRMDGIPVVLIEALACGLPVIASRLSGIPELIRDGSTGTLVEPGDIDGLVTALTELVTDGATVDPAAGRALVEREFDIATIARRLTKLFAEGPP
jgi:glycosyltransferase involved in cell wall biosynthesis